MSSEDTNDGKFRGAEGRITERGFAAQLLESARVNARSRVLAEASQAFSVVGTDYPSTLQAIARVVADLVGDGCIVTLLAEDGETLTNAASAHRDAVLDAAYRAYLAQMPVCKTTSASVSAAVVRTGQPKFMSQISPEVLVAQADDDLKPIVSSLNVHSFAVAPIRARKTVLGTLSLLRSGPGDGFKPDDVALLEDLACRAGLAIENARLYDDLERRVRRRTAELEAATRELEAVSRALAHDLRTPLRNIQALSGTLVQECSGRLPNRDVKRLEQVHAAADRMTGIVDLLLGAPRDSARRPQRDPGPAIGKTAPSPSMPKS
jgi:GAF domain-containing protein